MSNYFFHFPDEETKAEIMKPFIRQFQTRLPLFLSSRACLLLCLFRPPKFPVLIGQHVTLEGAHGSAWRLRNQSLGCERPLRYFMARHQQESEIPESKGRFQAMIQARMFEFLVHKCCLEAWARWEDLGNRRAESGRLRPGALQRWRTHREISKADEKKQSLKEKRNKESGVPRNKVKNVCQKDGLTRQGCSHCNPS